MIGIVFTANLLLKNKTFLKGQPSDRQISLIASDLIISCQTEKVKQHGGCAELCASLFRKKGEKMNTTKKIINRIVVCGAMIAIGINTYDL